MEDNDIPMPGDEQTERDDIDLSGFTWNKPVKELTFTETIALIREGKMAIENNGTKEQLIQLSKIIWPHDPIVPLGLGKFYFGRDDEWDDVSRLESVGIDESIPVTDLIDLQEKEESDLKDAVSQLGKKNIGAILAKESAAPCEAPIELTERDKQHIEHVEKLQSDLRTASRIPKEYLACEAVGEEKLKEGDAGFKWFTCPTCDGRGSVPQGQPVSSSESQEERFKKPTDEDIFGFALLFQTEGGEKPIDRDRLVDMVGFVNMVLDRLHEHGVITKKSSKEIEDEQSE